MTTPRYPVLPGCSEWSQVRGEASPVASDPDYAWAVYFNYGNVNINNRNNRCRVRAVRSAAPASQCQGVTFRALYEAWERARQNKMPSCNQLAFESKLIDKLLDLEWKIAGGTWGPRPTSCFVAQRPKAREIHAPDFGDRVVHHWLVPQLERVYENSFITDSFANIRGRGTHSAVDRLRQFVHQVDSGEGGGWYLQLDIHNFFNSIHRPTLYAMLKRRMVRAGVSLQAQRVAHALIATSAAQNGVVHCSRRAERALVPAHKRLENAAPGRGLPIGNLSSQFFANVYLDALDQFVKHELKAKRYLRYVDDFILVHQDRAQLEDWLARIETFLQEQLRLELKPDIRLRPLRSGIDFLGYVVYPTHTRVRRRVVTHASNALSEWARGHVTSRSIRATPEALRKLRSVWGSYEGHFRHANSRRLREGMMQRYPWLRAALRKRRFDIRDDDKLMVLKT